MAIKSYLDQGKPYYEISIRRRDSNGRSICRTARIGENGKRIASKASAINIERTLRAEVKNIIEQDQGLTWKTWHDKCLEKMKLTLKAGTVSHYDNRLKKMLSPDWDHKSLTKITRDDIFNLLNFMESQKECTKKQQKDYLQKIRYLLEMAVEEGIILKNPAYGIKIKLHEIQQIVLDTAQAKHLLDMARYCNHRFYYHWSLALLSGLRNGELYALRWPDIDLDNNTLTVSQQWTSRHGIHSPKNNRNRIVPISNELKPVLIELRKKGPFHDFVLPRLNEWRHGEQSKHLEEFCLAIGVEPIKFHDLRSTFAISLLSKQTPVERIVAILGYPELSFTEEYLLSKSKARWLTHQSPKINLLEAARHCNHSFYYHWALALYSGLRNSELYPLRWSDIDLGRGIISITRQWNRREGLHDSDSNRNRIVPIISHELKKILDELKKEGPFEENFSIHRSQDNITFNDLILPRHNGWKHGEQSDYLVDFCKKTGIDPIRFQDMASPLSCLNLTKCPASHSIEMSVAHKPQPRYKRTH